MNTPLTIGTHHIGLTVSNLEKSAEFFTSLLGWKEVKRKMDYPAIFVSDGQIMLTLWAVKDEPVCEFDRRKNIGLHHIAFTVPDEASLERLHDHLRNNGVRIEFPPELLKPSQAKHMMCYDPSGIRIEFIWPGK